MRMISLFAGIGGFELAGTWLGWEPVVSVEQDEKCQQVLKKNFPKTLIHGSIETFSGKPYAGTIDIICGGFPCQSFSLAGKGKLDLSLWKEMYRTIQEVGPRWIVAENVYGLIAQQKGVAIETVYNDLETEGYKTFPPYVLPACGVQAPHQRDRVWIIAYRSGNTTKTPSQGNRTYKKWSHNNEQQNKRRSKAKRVDGLFPLSNIASNVWCLPKGGFRITNVKLSTDVQ